MNKITAILVDDIPEALNLLASDIGILFPEIEIIGKAPGVVEASKMIQKQSPDILFLDINLGDGTGFDILEILPNLNSKIIFVTASDEYAIRAFKFAAIDYILKPYSQDELKKAIEMAIKQLAPKKEQLDLLKDTIKAPQTSPKKISLHTSEKIIVVDLNEIIRCEADNNYTMFYFLDGSHILVTKTLKTYADLLTKYDFLRVHQSHLVNIKYIKSFFKSDGGYLLLKDKSTVPVSVRKRAEVMEALHTI